MKENDKLMGVLYLERVASIYMATARVLEVDNTEYFNIAYNSFFFLWNA